MILYLKLSLILILRTRHLFKSHLEVRIKDKRNVCLVYLLEYLHDPDFLMENKFDIFGEYRNKNKMYTFASTLMQKLFGVLEPGPGEESQFASLASTSVCRDSSRASLKEKLERAITSASIPATRPSITPNLNRRMVQKECEVFEASGIRPANLQTLYEALLTIVKDSPLEGDESSIIVVTGGRPGPSSHCSLSNHQFKIKQ